MRGLEEQANDRRPFRRPAARSPACGLFTKGLYVNCLAKGPNAGHFYLQL
jgi:hypothetical protein